VEKENNQQHTKQANLLEKQSKTQTKIHLSVCETRMSFDGMESGPSGSYQATGHDGDSDELEPKLVVSQQSIEEMRKSVYSKARTGIWQRLKDPLLQKPSELLPRFLFLGNRTHALKPSLLSELGIKSIVNVSGESLSAQYPSGTLSEYLEFPEARDCDDYPVMDLYPAVRKAIMASEARGEGILVHCRQGISRSATLVIAYLMETKGWSLMTSLTHVAMLRPVVDPNDGFMKQLIEFEIQLSVNNIDDNCEAAV